MEAAYVFGVRFQLDPAGVAVDPAEFETVLRVPAPEPGEEGWLFFRNNLWRGNANDESHLRDRFSDRLGVPVTSVSFREFETDEDYREALGAAVEADLDAFNAESVREVLHKYFGSSVRVQ